LSLISGSNFPSNLYQESKNPLLAIAYFEILTIREERLVADVVFEPSGTTVQIFTHSRFQLSNLLPKFAESDTSRPNE